MSTWRDRLVPASFRGVPFFVKGSERAGGRRVVKHEYPGKDEPFTEDMGRRAREFSVEGFVVGSDYMTARDALLTALEEAGPGELIHPFYGARQVVALEFRVREADDMGGVAQFSLSFGETPSAPAQPTASVDASGAVSASASAAVDAAQVEFLASFSPGTLVDSLDDQLASALSKMAELSGPIGLGEQELALLTLKVQRLSSDARALLGSPAALFDRLSETVACFVDGSRAALLELYAFDPGPAPSGSTPARAAELQAFNALRRCFQRLVLVQAAILALGETFANYEAAEAARSELTDLLDDQAGVAADDTFPALLQLRADLVKAIPGEASDLPRIVSVTPASTLPSLVLTHRIYGSVDREADVIARNGIRDPRFVLGGRPLEVLSHD